MKEQTLQETLITRARNLISTRLPALRSPATALQNNPHKREF